jgi:hypothetical protein
MLAAARYRLGQVASLLAARRRPPDDRPAAELLPPELFALFQQMPAEDRRHALRVLADLRSRGATAPQLLQAGLLHDLGKAGAGVGLVHRVARVALKRTLPPLWRWLSAAPTGWRRPFWVVAHHPERGAVWVASAGAAPEVAALVRHHEQRAPTEWAGTPLAAWHAELAWADARS